MYKQFRWAKLPRDKEARVWRYMEFGALVSILQRKQLYFSPLDQFEDPHEGYSTAFSGADATADRFLTVLATLEDLDYHTTGEVGSDIAREKESVCRYRETLARRLRQYRAAVAVNCWHWNDDESVSMWQLYAKQRGVAVDTTIASLKVAFAPERRDIAIAQVVYTTAEKPTSTAQPSRLRLSNARPSVAKYSGVHATTKRRCFSHEKEIRALLFAPEQNNYVDVDLTSLIGRVWVSPFAPKFMLNVVKQTMRDYRLGHVPVIQSSLFDPLAF